MADDLSANTCHYDVSLSPDSGIFLENVLRRCLSDLVLALPALQVGIDGEHTKNPKFVRASSVKLSEHLLFSKGTSPDEQLPLLANQHTTAWPDIACRPPWKVICTEIQKSRTESILIISFAVHHALADGLSSVVFHTHLNKALNEHLRDTAQDQESMEDEIVCPHDGAKITAPLEELASLTISWSFFIKTIWNELGPNLPFQHHLMAPWTGDLTKTDPKRVRIKFLKFSPETLQKVLLACRAKQASLTSLLHALVLQALVQSLPQEVAHSFVASTPINLRPYLRSESDVGELMGAYYTSREYPIGPATVQSFRTATSDAHRLDAEIWAIAASIKSNLQQRLATLPQDDGIGMLRYVSDFRQFWLSKLGKPRSTSWEVSNIGSIPSVPDAAKEPLRPCCQSTEMYLTQSANVVGPAFSVNVASVENGAVSITLCWQETVVEEEVMDAIEVGLRDGLHSIAGEA